LMASGLRVHWVASASTLEDNERGAALARSIDQTGTTRRVLPDREFDSLASTERPQGVLAVADIPRATSSSLEPARLPAVVLVLDGVQDPGNFGTLVRSAEALGAQGVVALPGTVDPWNPKSIRAAAGSSFRLPVLQLGVAEGTELLRKYGYTIVGAEVSGRPAGEGLREKVALVVGNEGSGLSEEVVQTLDDTVGIPLRGRADSLNVAAAAAILLYELTR
jgi:RNA methyltransferase, TrmH family